MKGEFKPIPLRIGMDGMGVVVFYRAVNKFLNIVGFVLIILANL
jgi:hypothetical protein